MPEAPQARRPRAARPGDVADVVAGALRGLPAHTVTPDRGKEFAGWARVTEETGAEFCMCAAHRPWEKGCVENANGLLREYFPKGRSLEGVSGGEVLAVYDELNHRPRRRLGWRTPLGGVPLGGVALAVTTRRRRTHRRAPLP